MTVSTTTSRWTYVGNGVTVAFTYTNRIFAASDLAVYVAGVLKSLGPDYTVSGVGAAGGGTVTFAAAPANGATVALVRTVPATQAIDFVANEILRADVLELGLDKATVLVQQIMTQLARGLFLGESDPTGTFAALPAKSALAGKVLGFDAAGEPIAAVPPAEGTPVSAYAETLLDDADASTALSTLGVSTYIKTVLDDADASAAQSTLGVSTYIKTLLDDASAEAARATLAAAPDVMPGFKNRIINGNFQLWQRGTSLGSGTGKRYLADRWYNYSVGSTYTTAQQAFTLGQTDVPHEPTWFHRTVVTSVANAANY